MKREVRRRGFTLIELLVVIAIIAILAAILFPVFARARENARRSSCQSNLKQLALGVMQYTQDYDERFPDYAGTPSAEATYGWSGVLQPYLKSLQILQCPSDSTAFPTTDSVSGAGLANEVGYSDYAYNLWLGWTGGPSPSPGSTLSLAALTQVSLTVMIHDSLSGNGSTWETGGGSANCGTTACTVNARAVLKGGANRHLEGANFSFADGHVKWYRSANNSPTAMASVWNVRTDLATSGQSPTFNPMP